MFNPNDSFMYLIVAVVILFVLSESVYFLIKAWKRARKIGISEKILKKTVLSSAVFSIAPAVSTLLGVIALSKALGLPLPWLRLSVIGALTYETAAAAAAAAAQGYTLSNLITDPQVFSAIVWVMTIGIFLSMVAVPIIGKKIENGVMKIRSKDSKWGEAFMTALFLGLISAFLGVVFAGVSDGLTGWIPVFVLLTGGIVMGICGLFVKKLHWKWLENYALPISMISAMALAIPITHLVYLFV
jgi:cytochrome b561